MRFGQQGLRSCVRGYVMTTASCRAHCPGRPQIARQFKYFDSDYGYFQACTVMR